MSAQPQSSNVDDVQQSLYERREKIYPREVHGKFAFYRIVSAWILLGIYYGMPWLQWNERQALLLDLPARKFYLFGLVLWPQDFIYLTFLLIIAGLSLFFFTTLAGRLWCGYACPQTVWTESFLWIERLVEGDRGKQIKLDKAPWSLRKLRVKATKQLLWVALSTYTGFTFVGYFTPVRELFYNLWSWQLGPWETFWIIFYGFATYGNAGWMREQVCKYMCPYARFQSAMFDKDTLIVSYDPRRGEPRGARRHGVEPSSQGLGDCVNCEICVQVCPTGIDIRDGLQYECISCSACVDACDSVMDKMEYPRGLISYTTENALEGNKGRVLRPRVVIYAGALIVLLGALIYSVINRIPLQLDVIRDRNRLYREVDAGVLENVYTLKIINMDEAAHEFELQAEGLDGLTLLMDKETIKVASGEVMDLPVRLRAEEDQLTQRSSDVRFILQAKGFPHLKVLEDAKFIGTVQ
jgi:cytochrome c oxidase accessory protein FixG